MNETRGYMHRPVELDHFAPGKSYAVAASAGTGKTYLIQHLVAELVLEQDIPLRQILLVTYTEKAAAELKRRVREVLQTAVSPLPYAPTGPHRLVTLEKQERAKRALADFDLVTMGTIHQFCLSSLRELGVLAGVPPLIGAQISDDPIDEALRSELRAEVRTGTFADLWRGLSGSARDALLEHARKVAPHQHAARPDVDELERAAAALVTRWRTLGSPTYPEAGLHPFHKEQLFGAKSETTAVVGYRSFSRTVFETCASLDAGTLSAADALAVPLALAFAQLGNGRANQCFAGIYKVRSNPCHTTEQREFVEAAVQLCEDARALAAVRLGRRVRARVEALHDERGTLTYHRMVSLLADALEGETARGTETPLHAALQARYRVGIVDEFQDTDPHQWSIFRALFLPGQEAGRRRDGQLFLVGDEKQAIYRFRGADLHTYRRATAELMDAAGTHEVTLDTNWRSTKELLEGLQLLLAPRLFIDDKVPYGQVTAGGGCRFAYEPERPPVTFLCPRPRENDDDKGLTKDELDRALAEGIAAEALRLTRDPVPRYQSRGMGAARALRLSDICVLGRGQRELDIVARALHRAGLPFAQYKRAGLYTSAEALDLLDLFLALMHEHDAGALSRALSTCFFAVPARELDAMRGLSSDHPLTLQLKRWRSLASDGAIPALLRHVEHESQVISRLLFLEGERAAANLRQLLDQVLALHRSEGWLLPQLCRELQRRVRQARDDDKGREHGLMQLETEREVITLMTMHTSKGLQFPVVFLAGGYRGRAVRLPDHPVPLVDDSGTSYLALSPSAEEPRSHYERAEREDDARLLYVAATRAEAKLYLPHWHDDDVSDAFDAKLYARIREQTHRLLSSPHPLVGMQAAGAPEAVLPPLPGTMSAAAEVVLRSVTAPEINTVHLDEARVALARPTFGLTSFTREHHANRGGSPAAFDAVDPALEVGAPLRDHDEPDEDAESSLLSSEEEAPSILGPPLPRGAAFGTLVHRALEHEDYGALRRAASLEAWLEGTPETLRRCIAAGFNDDTAKAVCGLVYRTVTQRWSAARREGGLLIEDVLPPFAALDEVRFEAPFLLPIPERAHPAFVAARGDGEPPCFSPKRGYVTGSIDAVFRHEGRTSLVDWKTNRVLSVEDAAREDYSPSRLLHYTEGEYGLQLELYALALLRWLQIRGEKDYEARFGGVFYVYLRGTGGPLGPQGHGIFHWLPRYDEVLALMERLVERQYAGAPLCAPGQGG